MVATGSAELDLIKLAAQALTNRGYRIILEPSPSLLPIALRDAHPDAIAVGKQPNLIIQVASEGRAGSEQLLQLRETLKSVADWELYLVYSRDTSPTTLAVETLPDITSLLRRADAVAKEDTRAGLLICWACLEALARFMEPTYFGKPQTPGRIVERLASRGDISASEAAFLRRMAKIRNDFIHGQLLTAVEYQEVQRMTKVVGELAKVVAGQASSS